MTIDRAALIAEAFEAARSAYAPYSRFAVGAAVLLADGRIVPGADGLPLPDGAVDVIVAVDGRAVESRSMLRNRVARIPPLTQVRILLVRNGQEREIPAVLGEWPTGDRDG